MIHKTGSNYVALTSSTGNDAVINDEGQLHVVQRGKVDTGNSTESSLLALGVWNGTSIDILDYAGVGIQVHSDVAGTLQVQFSPDDIEWRDGETYNIIAGGDKFFTPTLQNPYMRLIYTNGGVNTTDFGVHTTLHKNPIKWSSHNIDVPIKGQDDAELVKAVITGKKDNGDFDNASLTNAGNVKVSINEYGDTPAIDAFDRLRISEPFTLFDSKQLHDKQPLFWDEELGGSATSVHSSVNAETRMSVTTSATDYVIRQTKQRFNYQPGKSQLIFMTFHSPQVEGATKRVGIFDGTGTNNLTPNNGIFYECNGDLIWNICKDGTTTEAVAQSDWNVDRLDGTGISGITLDMDGTQIIVIDYEWLGVGRVRVGFVINGLVYYVHYFNHANDPTYDSVYMSSPNLPLRYDITTDGTTATHLDHICSSVISEGGIEKTGILRSVENDDSFVGNYSTGNKYALLGIRLKDAYKDITIIPESIQVVLGTSDSFKWELHINPVIANTFTYSDLSNSATQFAQGVTNNTVTTDGLIIARGGGSTSSRGAQADLETALRIGSTIAGVKDEMVLVFRPLSNQVTIWATLNFRELL